MTQEQKELLLKDLCARLSYGVRAEILNNEDIRRQVVVSYGNICYVPEIGKGWWKECKPYLFPLSSMTVEQRCKAQNLLPNNCEISFINSKITFYGENCCEIKLEQFDKLFKFFDSQHVDYRGLIPMGLALDATSKNIY